MDGMPLKDLLEFLSETYEVPIRIDLSAFARIGVQNATGMYEQPVKLPVVRGMSVSDVLRDALAQLPTESGEGGRVSAATFRIRDGQILIVPAFVTPFSSVGSGPPAGNGGSGAEEIQIDAKTMLEQTEGDPISFSIDEKSFADVLKELRRMTGANIVLDARQKDKAKLTITAEMHDVRLLAGLRILCDMCELQPVSLNNIYYITSKENAERLQKELDRKHYGEAQLPLQYYGGLGGPGLGGAGLGGFGGGGLGGAIPAPQNPIAPPPAAKPEPTKPVEKKQSQ